MYDLGFRVECLGFTVAGFRFRVQGLEVGVSLSKSVPGVDFDIVECRCRSVLRLKATYRATKRLAGCANSTLFSWVRTSPR